MSSELVPGTKIGHYELVATLGDIGNSRVHLCEDLNLKRRVAVKQLRPGLDFDAADSSSLLEGGKLLTALHHRNVAQVYEIFATESGAQYLVTELLHGCSLESYLSSHKPLRVEDAFRIAEQVCSAMQQAHTEGIAHGAIKPSSLFLCDKKMNSIKLINFKIGKEADSEAMSDDQYALACVLYECLAGHPPFPVDEQSGMVTPRAQQVPTPLKQKQYVTPAVRRTLERAMLPQSRDRFDTMDAFFKSMAGLQNVTPESERSMLLAIIGIVVIVIAAGIFGLSRSASVYEAAHPLPPITAPVASENQPNTQSNVQSSTQSNVRTNVSSNVRNLHSNKSQK